MTNTCLHCGQPANGSEYCCTGCQIAYQLIRGAGLQNFYDQQLKREPVSSRATSEYDAFDHEEFLNSMTRLEGEFRSARFLIEGLQCPACLWLVEKLPKLAPNCIRAEVSFSESSLFLIWRNGDRHLSEILRTLAKLGYQTFPYREDEKQKLLKRWDWVRVGVSGASASAAMHIGILFYAGYSHPMDAGDAFKLGVLSAVVSIPAVFYGGWPFMKSAFAALRLRIFHPDLLIASALMVGYFASLYRTARGQIEVYYDSIAMVTFLLLIGRALVKRASQVRPSVHLWRARKCLNVGDIFVPTSALKVGDVIRVESGEEVPLDLELLEGEAWLDESVLTGEAASQRRIRGQNILEGSRNDGAGFRGRVVSEVKESSLSKIVEKVREVSISVPLSKFEQFFTLGIFGLVGLVLVFDPSHGISKALALLVVTCPCALLLSKPLILDKAREEAMKMGFLLLNPFRFMNSAKARTIGFDKTGTLTEGRARVVDEKASAKCPDGFRSAIYEICVKSSHPISRALCFYLEKFCSVSAVVSGWEEVQGRGPRAIWEGREISIRPAGDFSALRPTASAWLGEEEVIRFEFEDKARAEVGESLLSLEKMGFSFLLLSGDRASSVNEFASKFGRWSKALGELKAEDKARYLDSGSVYVGDGLNDALSMRSAGFSIGFSGSAESNLSAADAYLLKKDLRLIPRILMGARRSVQLLKWGYGVSLVYNVVTIILVLDGRLGPILCAIFMPLSSLTVLAIARSFRF